MYGKMLHLCMFNFISDSMEDLVFVYFVVNFISMLPVVWGADKRTVNNLFACVITLLFSPVVGFLLVLCYPLKEDVEYQEMMLVRMEKILQKLEKGEEN